MVKNGFFITCKDNCESAFMMQDYQIIINTMNCLWQSISPSWLRMVQKVNFNVFHHSHWLITGARP